MFGFACFTFILTNTAPDGSVTKALTGFTALSQNLAENAGIDDPITSWLDSMVDMEPAAETRQQSCSCGSSSRCLCQDCNEALCDVCLLAHRRVTVTRSHRISNQPPAGDVSTPPIKFCRLHPSEPLKLFCFTCNELTCRDCQLAAHMNHRYQFVKEALAAVKKWLENRVQPITAQKDTMSRSLMDMETRLQDISESLSNLRSELQQSFSFITEHLIKRKEEVLRQAEEVSLLEYEGIKMKMTKTMQLLKNQQLMMKMIEKAQNINDLSALRTYAAQVDRQLKECPDLGVAPPLVMSNLKVVTDRTALEAVLRFGALEVKWIPFSVSQTTNKKTSKASSPPTPTVLPPPDRPLPQTRTTIHSPVAVGSSATTSKSSSSKLRHSPSSSSNVIPTTSTCLATPCGALPQNGNTCNKDSPGPVNHPKHLLMLQNPSPVNLPPSSDPSSVLKPVQPSLAVNEENAPQNQNQSSTALLHSTQTTSCFTLLSAIPQFPVPLTPILPGNTSLRNQKSLMGNISPETLPATTNVKKKMNPDSGGPSVAAPHQPLEDVSFTTTRRPSSPDQCLAPDLGHHSSSLKDQQQNPVVRAVADSACDSSIQPVAARRPEPAEDEPTSTVSEEPAPAGERYVFYRKAEEPEPAPLVSDTEHEPSDTKPEPAPEVSDTEPEEPLDTEPAPLVSDTKPESEPEESGTKPEQCSVIGHPYCIMSQWQPRVSLFRLPVTPPLPGRPNPCFVLVPGDAEDEIYLKEMREDIQPDAGEVADDDITELPPSPDSPVTLVTVTCAACRSANSSIICSFCGRGFHRGCHDPPVGPDIRSEWICSLCQDLLDPSDPFSSDRPPRPQSPCLSLQDQRRCERLLLQLKVEGCSHLGQSQLTSMSERLSLRRRPSYETAAEFLRDTWSLFPASQDDDVLTRLKENLRLASESMSTSPSSRRSNGGKPAAAQRRDSGLQAAEGPKGSKVKWKEPEGTRESSLKKTSKRLRNLLDPVQAPRPKRTKRRDAPLGDSGK